jgi:hypothetical protein
MKSNSAPPSFNFIKTALTVLTVLLLVSKTYKPQSSFQSYYLSNDLPNKFGSFKLF